MELSLRSEVLTVVYKAPYGRNPPLPDFSGPHTSSLSHSIPVRWLSVCLEHSNKHTLCSFFVLAVSSV